MTLALLDREGPVGSGEAARSLCTSDRKAADPRVFGSPSPPV